MQLICRNVDHDASGLHLLDQIFRHELGGARTRDENAVGAILDEVDRVESGHAVGGEIRRGAHLVDGIEYDPFFVELANAINAYNGTTRVSFYEGDITDRSTYRESYDIVLAFSVFIYIGQIMDMISLITRDVLVLETHRLDGNLDATYLKTISPFFPHHRLVGDSEWGLPHGGVDRRAILAFAKSKHVLDSIVPELLGATAVS